MYRYSKLNMSRKSALLHRVRSIGSLHWSRSSLPAYTCQNFHLRPEKLNSAGWQRGRQWLHMTPVRMDSPSAETWPEHEFLKTAEDTLSSLHDSIESRSDKLGDEFDIDLSMGVLTVELGEDHGTYVVNTQTPNRQLWLSSPKSGPARYYYDMELKQWRSSRDNHFLREKLNSELTGLGIPIPLEE